jgi:NAD(P) transhydrogenase
LITILWHACAMEHTYDFDLAVIGSGPGGQKAAIMAAKLGHKVCVIDSKSMVGGVCVNTGTIPSKTLREAVLYLTGMQLRDLYGASYRVKEEITISDLLARQQHVVGRETEVIRSQLMRNHIELVAGHASFLDPHTLTVEIEGLGALRTLTANNIVIGTGKRRLRWLTCAGFRPDPHARHGAGFIGCGRRRRYWRGICLDLRCPRHPGDAG